MSENIYDISLFTIYKVSIHIFSPIQSDVCIFQESLEIRLEICLERASSVGGEGWRFPRGSTQCL